LWGNEQGTVSSVRRRPYAENAEGNERRFFMNIIKLNRFLVTALFSVLAVSVWAQTGNRYALVIGNAEYQRIDKLKNTINDAQDISAALQSLGYQVDLKFNLGHLQMVDAIEAFTTKLSSGNRVANEGFFWYAGHAVQIQDENYLLPVDITVDTVSRVRAGSFSLNNLIDMLDKANNRVNVLILDACRDNPLPSTGRGGGGRGLAIVAEPPSDLFIMFSTAPGNKADDGAAGKRNSPFAEAFLKHIKSNEPLSLMAVDVTQETLNLTGQRQRPFHRGSMISEKYYSLNPQGGISVPKPVVQPIPQPAPQPIPPTTPDALEKINPADAWKYQWFYAGFNAGYTVQTNRPDDYNYIIGKPFGFSFYFMVQPFDLFGIALDFSGDLIDGPNISIVPTLTIRPSSFEIDLFFGVGLNVYYSGAIAITGGGRAGYKLGPGVLYTEIRPTGILNTGEVYYEYKTPYEYYVNEYIPFNINFTLGYQIGFSPRKK